MYIARPNSIGIRHVFCRAAPLRSSVTCLHPVFSRVQVSILTRKKFHTRLQNIMAKSGMWFA